MQRTCASGVLVLYYCRQRPTLPHSCPCSTIGGSRLNFRVRNGNGCDPAPMTTGKPGRQLCCRKFEVRGSTLGNRSSPSNFQLLTSNLNRVFKDQSVAPEHL